MLQVTRSKCRKSGGFDCSKGYAISTRNIHTEVEYSPHPTHLQALSMQYTMSPSLLRWTHYTHPFHPYNLLLNTGINVCANQKLKTSFGPVMSSFGVKPLKKLENPSFFAILLRIRKPLSGLSKFRFWIRVFMTSRGAETMREAEAPAMEATKFWLQEAEL